MDLIWTLLIGLIAGRLAGHIMKGKGLGMVGDLLLGVVGSLAGGFLFGLLGLYSSGGLIGRLVVSTVGAAALLWIARKLNGR